MPVRKTPHREAYEKFVRSGFEGVIRGCLSGARVGNWHIEVGQITSRPPSISEHQARLNRRDWRGWVQAEVLVGDGFGRPARRVEPVIVPLPWMSDSGTFIRKGVELVPVVQLLPRPGAWVRSSVNESGTRRTTRIDIIPTSGSRLRILQSSEVDSSTAGPEPPRVIWITNFQHSLPTDLESLKELLASSSESAWVPRLNSEAQARFSKFIEHVIGVPRASGQLLTVADLDAIEKCLQLDSDHPEGIGAGFGSDPADLAQMRAWTIADQVEEALSAAFSVALDRAQVASSELTPTQDGEIDIAARLAAELSAFGRAALTLDPAPGGVVMEWTTRTRVRAPFSDGRLLQPLDETNPLAEHSHLHKVTRGGPGGVNSQHGAVEHRELHPTQLGALCPFETPESEHLGLRLHLAAGYKIEDGALTSASEDPLASDSWLGAAASLLPFLCHNDAARGLMAAKNLKQAVTLVKPERPLVATGRERDVAAKSGAVVFARAAGTVSAVEEDSRTGSTQICVERPGVRGAIVRDLYVVPTLRPTAAGTIAGLEARVKVGSSVREGDVIAAHPSVVGDELALGVNLRVAYMPFHGLNSEDGIVVSDRLVRDQVLASRHLVRVHWAVPSGRELRRGNIGSTALDSRGIVRVGEWVDTGDEIARAFPKPDSGLTTRATFISRTAKAGEFGTVVSTNVRRNAKGLAEVEIWLESIRHLEVGDKLTGRHGNKGVVTAILPEDQMPNIDGVGPVDAVLSPVGMLNRMILGALAETQVGWYLKHSKNEATEQATGLFPSGARLDADDLAEWMRDSQHVDESGRVPVRLGVGGELTDQPVVVGYQYFVKLNHLAQNKVVFRGIGNMGSKDSYGRASHQPVRGRRVGGGQRLGEMESWALAAWGVPALLDEFRGLKADDVERRSHFLAALTAEAVPLALTDIGEKAHVSEAWFGLQTLLVALGFNLQLVLKADGHAAGKATLIGPLVPGLQRPLISEVARVRCDILDDDALKVIAQERRLLGGDLAVGLQEMSLPLVKAPSVSIRRGEWLQLACGCAGLADQILDRRQKGGWKCLAHEKPYSSGQVVSVRSDLFGRPASIYASEIWGGLDSDIRASVAYGLIDLSEGESKGSDKEVTYRHPLTGKAMRYVPVVPPMYRRGNHVLDRAYAQVVRSTRAYCAIKNRQFDGARLQSHINDLFDSLLVLVGTKDGFVRQRMIGKRVDLSGRAVVVAQPELGIDDCGLPLEAAVGACETELRRRVNATLEKTRRSREQLAADLKQASAGFESGVEVQRWMETRQLSFGALLKRLKCNAGEVLSFLQSATNEEVAQRLDLSPKAKPNHARVVTELLDHGRGSAGGALLGEWLESRGFDAAALEPEDQVTGGFALAQVLQTWSQELLDRHGVKVLLNRQPTLQRYGLMAFAPRVRVDNVIGLSPIVCSAFNADFDGDTMAIHIPATRQACEQAWNRMRPSVNLFSVAAGQPVLQLSHEARAGLLIGSLTKTSEFDDVCAGLLNEMKSSARESAAWAEPELAMHAVRKGFDWATKAGLSPSWSDLGSGAVRSLALDLGTSGGGDTRLAVILASLPPMSPIAVLARSRALRRPAEALIQLCYRRGAFAKLTGGITAEVKTSLVDGLGSEDLFLSCYGARKTLAEKKMLTPKAGELTRLLAWATGHYRIVEGDCKTEVRLEICDLSRDGHVILAAKQWQGTREDTNGVRSPLGCQQLIVGKVCQACYGPVDASARPPARNLPVGMSAATSIGERGTQLALRTFHTGGVAGSNAMVGFPRVRAMFLGHHVRVSGRADQTAWDTIAASGRATTGDAESILRLQDIRDLQSVARVFMFEMFENYKVDEIDPRHFELVLASLLHTDGQGGVGVRSLLAAARDQESPFDAMAFGYVKQSLKRLRARDYELGPTTKIRLLGGMQ